MKNKIIALLFALILAGCSCLPALAGTHTPYGNVNDNSSQVNILVSAMLNYEEFDPYLNWVCWQEGQNDYRIAFNWADFDDTVYFIRYYQTGNFDGWQLTNINTESNFFVNTYSKSCVGAYYPCLQSSKYIAYMNHLYIKWCLPILAVIITFSVFRIRKSRKGVLC